MDNPYAQQSEEKARENLRLALAMMTRHGLAPTPTNYRLAYDYVEGNSQAMQEALDQALEATDKHTRSTSLWEIYQRFFVQDGRALQKLRQDLRLIIGSVQEEFQRSGGALTGFGQQLSHFATLLEKPAAVSDMPGEVRKMIAGTQSMAQTHVSLDSRMNLIQEEVEALRRELEQVREESMTDALTGIANRRSFDLNLGAEIGKTGSHSRPLSLLMVDIDHFKQFNDQHGHLVGDKVLRYVGLSLKACVKGQDFPARYGGEEFSVILPDTSAVGARAIAEQIRGVIASRDLKDKVHDRNYGRITASIGVAEYRAGETEAELIGRCDAALYQAKQRGRNRVVVG